MPWDVTLGNALTFFGMVIALVVSHTKNAERIRGMEIKIDMMFESWLKERQAQK
jgi:hypothetical protein